MTRAEAPPPSSFHRWACAHAPVLYAVGAVMTAFCVWRLVGALISPATRDVLGASLNTLTWVLLTLQVRVIVRYVARHDRRQSSLEEDPGAGPRRSLPD